MDIYQDVELRGLGIYLRNSDTLVISDPHVGYERSMHKQGVLVPPQETSDMLERLEELMKDAKNLIILGDIQHSFSGMDRSEWKELREFLTDVRKLVEGKIILIKGNHDTALDAVKMEGVEVRQSYSVDGFDFVHGDEKLETDGDVIVIGHEHPAVVINDSKRFEKYKCFLKGRYDQQALLVLPSFNTLTEGTDIRQSDILSPYVKDAYNFEVYVMGDKHYYFGYLAEL